MHAQPIGYLKQQTNPMCRERFPVSRGVVPIEIGLGKMLIVTLTKIRGKIFPGDAI